MTTLKEFLLTADVSDQIALEQARNFKETRGRFITSNTLTVYVVQLQLYAELTDIANTPNHPIRDICMAFMDRLRGVSDFNFILGTEMGDANIALLEVMKSGVAEPLKSKLTQLGVLASNYCNEEIYPFDYASLYTIMSVRDTCPKLLIEPIDGYFVIDVSEDVEAHSPAVFSTNSRTGDLISVGRFPIISKAGRYEVKAPTNYYTFTVDDAYGVITCLKTL